MLGWVPFTQGSDGLDFETWAGLLGTMLLANMITAWWAYAMLWTEVRQRKGLPQGAIPLWALLAMLIAPAVSAVCLYIAFY